MWWLQISSAVFYCLWFQNWQSDCMPEGYAILGGILDREREALCAVLDRANLVLDEMIEDGEWLCAIARKSQ